MSLSRLDNLGAVGVIRDLPSYNLPLNAWSDSINVDFEYLTVKRSLGFHSSVNIGAPKVTPFFSFLGLDSEIHRSYAIYASTAKVYAILDGVHVNITRTTSTASSVADINYSATVNKGWSATEINGVLVMNNAVDVPQKWTTATSSQRLVALDGWTSTVRAAVIRSYKNYLVALDIRKGGVRFPHLVKWSVSASVGHVPTSWNIADATKDAGQVALVDTPDYCIDSAPLRDINIIYKEETTWGMRFIGFPFIFQFFRIFGNSGIIARDCIAEDFDKHYVITNNDIIVHDGQTIQSLVNNRIRRDIFSNLTRENSINSFITLNKFEKILIVGIPVNSSYPDRLFIMRLSEGAWRILSIDPINAMTFDFGITGGSTYAASVETYDATNRLYNDTAAYGKKMVAVSSTKNKLFSVFSGILANGVEYISRVERTGFSFLEVSEGSDEKMLKLINYIRPEISASSAVTINIYLGVQDTYNNQIDWGTPVAFNTATDKEAWFFKVGRYFGVKFETIQGSVWELKGYSIDISPFGLYS